MTTSASETDKEKIVHLLKGQTVPYECVGVPIENYKTMSACAQKLPIVEQAVVDQAKIGCPSCPNPIYWAIGGGAVGAALVFLTKALLVK